MGTAGKNRYELLFVDEESIPMLTPDDSGGFKKKGTKSATLKTKKISDLFKKDLNVEKENKSGMLNKSGVVDGKSRTKAQTRGSQTRLYGGGDSRNVAFKSENQLSEQRKRRLFREGYSKSVGFSSSQREPRQLRDRENRGLPRNREGFYRSGKREFDRQSGSDKTGVKAVDKREGAGAHNWGSVKQEIGNINRTSDANAALIDKEELSNEQTNTLSAGSEEAEAKELTLDEWRAIRGERAKPQYNIRKPNEGEDTSQWKKMVALNKKKNSDSEEEYEYDPSMYPQRVGRLQRIVNIQFNFNDGRRDGGFGKGRGRVSRSNCDNKGCHQDDKQFKQHRSFGNRQQKEAVQNVFKVDDELQFPTLI